MNIINTVIIIGLSASIFGCTAIHRVEISPLGNGVNSIDKIKLNDAFIDNGYAPSSWEYKTIFYPAHRPGQVFVGHWGKDHYHKNKKRGGTEAWIVTEGSSLVVYIVGDYDIFDRTEELVEDLSVCLPILYPDGNISFSKKYFFDFR